jgi:hypothetical protein
MKLTQLAAKPQLIEITLDDPALVTKYGEPITFHTWDRQPMDVFVRLANATEASATSVIHIVKDLILDENGVKVMADDTMIPTDVLLGAIGKITAALGN